MFITYHRAGKMAVLPALAVAGVVVVLGGIAATIAVTALVVVGVTACGLSVLRAVGLGGRPRGPAVGPDEIIEGVVVSRSSVDDEPVLLTPRGSAQSSPPPDPPAVAASR